MTRLLTLLAFLVLAAGLAFGPKLMEPAVAQGSSSGSGTKICKAKTPQGKTKTWRCGKNQACCVNQTMGIYVCGYPGLGCL